MKENVITFIGNSESSVYKEVTRQLSERGFRRTPSSTPTPHLILKQLSQDVDFCRLGGGPRRPLVNFYRGMKSLTLKGSLVDTMRDVPGVWEVLPGSHVLLSAKDDAGRERFIEDAARGRGEQAVWIAKVTGGAKGKGMKVSRDPAEIMAHVDEAANGRAWVVQRYITRPLLLRGGRKFDIRMWVCVDEHFACYVYRSGVLRTCSVPFTLEDLGDQYAHLSNHCIQETHAAEFGKFEEGNEMFFDEFERYLREAYGHDMRSTVYAQIKDQVALTLQTVRPKVENTDTQPYRSFQLLGYDFLVEDAAGKPKVWLLEVNAAPACAAKLNAEVCSALVQVAILPALAEAPINTPPVGECYPGTLFERVL